MTCEFCQNPFDICSCEQLEPDLCQVCQVLPANSETGYCSECCGYCGNKCYANGVWHCEEYIKDQEEEEERERLYGDNPCYQHYRDGVSYYCDICRIIKCDKCQLSIQERNTINGLCQFCYVPEKVSNPVADCLTFIIDRIVDAETNSIKENECPVCMEQIPTDRCDLITTGDNCEHHHCGNCLHYLENSTNKCSICRSVLKEPEPADIAEEEEEFTTCEYCDNEVPWDGHLGVRLCNECYSSEVQLGHVEQNIPDGFTIAIINGQRTSVDLNIPNPDEYDEIICCDNCQTHSNMGALLDLLHITGEDGIITVCSQCEINLQKCSGCGRRNIGEWRSRHNCRFCDQCFELNDTHLNLMELMESNHQIEMDALRLEANRL